MPEMFREGLSGFTFYFMMVVFSFIFSLGTWFAFLLAIMVVKFYCKKKYLIKWLVFLSGMALTAGSFLLVLGTHEIFHDEFGILMCANCACIGWGVWFYRLDTRHVRQNDQAEQLLEEVTF